MSTSYMEVIGSRSKRVIDTQAGSSHTILQLSNNPMRRQGNSYTVNEQSEIFTHVDETRAVGRSQSHRVEQSGNSE